MQGIETKSGWRYVLEIPAGYESAVFTSKELYPSRGAAIDAMREKYPPKQYPSAKRSYIADEEAV